MSTWISTSIIFMSIKDLHLFFCISGSLRVLTSECTFPACDWGWERKNTWSLLCSQIGGLLWWLSFLFWPFFTPSAFVSVVMVKLKLLPVLEGAARYTESWSQYKVFPLYTAYQLSFCISTYLSFFPSCIHQHYLVAFVLYVKLNNMRFKRQFDSLSKFTWV